MTNSQKANKVMTDSEMLDAFNRALIEKIEKMGGEVNDIYRLVASDSWQFHRICEEIVDSANEYREIFRVMVDFDMSTYEVEQLVGRRHRYSFSMYDNNFPMQGDGQQDFEMKEFSFDCPMTSDEIITEMVKEGWQPAGFRHLCFFTVQYPNYHASHGIVALGQVHNNQVSCLDRYDDGRNAIHGISYERQWPAHDSNDYRHDVRFLAVRPVNK